MAKTASDVINDARAILQDTDSQLYRYSTADLVSYLNTALLEAKRLRPDLFVSYIGEDVPSFTEGTLNSDFPIDEMYFSPIVFYVVGFAELRDDEFTVDARAATLMNQFTSKFRAGV